MTSRVDSRTHAESLMDFMYPKTQSDANGSLWRLKQGLFKAIFDVEEVLVSRSHLCFIYSVF